VQRDVRDDASTSRYMMGGGIDVEFFLFGGQEKGEGKGGEGGDVVIT
jgi:hypothetical protein